MRLSVPVLLGSSVLVASVAAGATLTYVAPGSRPDISADGRYISFSTDAQLVPDDTNGLPDIYVVDRSTGTWTRASVSSTGVQGTDFDTTDGHFSALSADGRHVAFDSIYSNLVAGDTNDAPDVFVHDLDTGQTTCVSVGVDGLPGNGPSISHYHRAGISADGRFVAFTSLATNLIAGGTNLVWNVFVRDRDTDGNGVFDEPGGTITELISAGPNGEQETVYTSGGGAGANITPDGRFVAFVSGSRTLLPGGSIQSDAYVYDRQTRTMERVSVAPDGAPSNRTVSDVAISNDG